MLCDGCSGHAQAYVMRYEMEVVCCDRCEGFYQYDTDAAEVIWSGKLSVPKESVNCSVIDEAAVIVVRVAGGRGARVDAH